MQIMQAQPAVWVYTTGPSYNQVRAPGAPWLTAEQRARLERIRQARMLFQGKHREYFLDEKRTQFDFPPMKTAGNLVSPLYVKFNILKLVSKKTADLLFGEDPLLRVADTIQQGKLDELVKRSSLQELFKNCAVECSGEAETFLEACILDGQAYLQRVPAEEIFPIGSPRPDGQYRLYQRFGLKNVGTAQAPIWILLLTTYAPGLITRALWQLDEAGNKTRELSLDQWNAAADGSEPIALQPEIRTGIPENTITWIPNEIDHDLPVSDYDGLVELQDELNAKQSQVARVLAQHSDPGQAWPEESADEDGNVRADHKVSYYRDPERIPKYITWEAQLDAALKDRDFVLRGLLILAEMSPALLGLTDGAAAESWKKFKLSATNALSMAQRKASTWKPRIARAIQVCQELEQTLPGMRYDVSPVGVDLQDGIPQDDEATANQIATLLPIGAMSRERAVDLQIKDPAAAALEIKRIAHQQAAATPSILLGNEAEMRAGGDMRQGDGTNNEQTPATAGKESHDGQGS